jgi:hypothetical protein
MDEDTRKALLWLAESVLPEPQAAMWCRCGHDIAHHATDEYPDRSGSCMFPIDAPVRLCRCQLFTEPE